MTAPRSRVALHRRLTTYEVVADIPTGRIRLGFVVRPSKTSLLRLAREHSAALLPYVSDSDTATYSADAGLRLGAKVVVRRSGRTERECADEEVG